MSSEAYTAPSTDFTRPRKAILEPICTRPKALLALAQAAFTVTRYEVTEPKTTTSTSSVSVCAGGLPSIRDAIPEINTPLMSGPRSAGPLARSHGHHHHHHHHRSAPYQMYRRKSFDVMARSYQPTDLVGIAKMPVPRLPYDVHERRQIDKPFLCSQCDARFERQAHLDRHFRSHTGEKPFMCEFEGCGKRFSRKDNCRQHTKLHLKDAKPSSI